MERNHYVLDGCSFKTEKGPNGIVRWEGRQVLMNIYQKPIVKHYGQWKSITFILKTREEARKRRNFTKFFFKKNILNNARSSKYQATTSWTPNQQILNELKIYDGNVRYCKTPGFEEIRNVELNNNDIFNLDRLDKEKKRNIELLASNIHFNNIQLLQKKTKTYCHLVLILNEEICGSIKPKNLVKFLKANRNNCNLTVFWHISQSKQSRPSQYYDSHDARFGGNKHKAFCIKIWTFNDESTEENLKMSDAFETLVVAYGYERQEVVQQGIQLIMLNTNFKFRSFYKNFKQLQDVKNIVTLGRTSPIICLCDAKDHDDNLCTKNKTFLGGRFVFGGNIHLKSNEIYGINLLPTPRHPEQYHTNTILSDKFSFLTEYQRNSPQWTEEELTESQKFYIETKAMQIRLHSENQRKPSGSRYCYLLLLFDSEIGKLVRQDNLIEQIQNICNNKKGTIEWYVGKCTEPRASRYHTSKTYCNSTVRRRLLKGYKVFQVKLWKFEEKFENDPLCYEIFESYILMYGKLRHELKGDKEPFKMINKNMSPSVFARTFEKLKDCKKLVTLAETRSLLCLSTTDKEECDCLHEIKEIPEIGGNRFNGNLHINQKQVHELKVEC